MVFSKENGKKVQKNYYINEHQGHNDKIFPLHNRKIVRKIQVVKNDLNKLMVLTIRGGVIMALKTKQIELLEAMLANPMAPDVKLAEQLGLNNKTVGKWRKLPEFQEELKNRLAEQWKSAERIAQRTMIDLATEGDFKASQYILNSLGYAPVQKIEADIANEISVSIEE